MARPKKDPKEDGTVTLSFKEFVSMQNFVASSLAQKHHMVNLQAQGITSLMTAVSTARSMLQTHARNHLANNDFDPDKDVSLEDFPALYTLLRADKDQMHDMSQLATLGQSLAESQQALMKATSINAPPAKQKKPKKPRDPNAPRRPVTAFFLFLKENREELREKAGDNASNGDVQTLGKNEWNNANAEFQEIYKAKYRQNFAAYQKELKEYKDKGGSVDATDFHEDDAEAAVEDEEDKQAPVVDESASVSSDSSRESEEAKTKTPTPPPPKKGKGGKKGKQASPEPTKAGASAARASPEKKKKRGGKEEATAESNRKRKDSPEPEPGSAKKKKKATKDDAEAKRKKRAIQGYGDDDY